MPATPFQLQNFFKGECNPGLVSFLLNRCWIRFLSVFVPVSTTNRQELSRLFVAQANPSNKPLVLNRFSLSRRNSRDDTPVSA